MSRQVSPSTGRPYGLARASRVWSIARATIYRFRHPSCVPPAGQARAGRCPMLPWSRRSALC